MDSNQTVPSRGSSSGKDVLVALVVVGLAGVAVLLGIRAAFGGDDVDAPVTTVRSGVVAPDLYRQITLGIDKEALTELLLPARPVDTRVLERYDERSPETVASSCVYYEAGDGLADDLYRFCFEQD